VGFCTTPSASTSVCGSAPLTDSVTLDTFVPHAFVLSNWYLKPAEGRSTLVVDWPRQPANCCSSASLMSCVVTVIVVRLWPKGCTVKASPYGTLPSPSPAGLPA